MVNHSANLDIVSISCSFWSHVELISHIIKHVFVEIILLAKIQIIRIQCISSFPNKILKYRLPKRVKASNLFVIRNKTKMLNNSLLLNTYSFSYPILVLSVKILTALFTVLLIFLFPYLLAAQLGQVVGSSQVPPLRHLTFPSPAVRVWPESVQTHPDMSNSCSSYNKQIKFWLKWRGKYCVFSEENI